MVKVGYKQTEVGIIPNNWEIRKLIEVVNYADYRGKTPPKTNSGMFLVTAKNIRMGFIDYKSSREYVSADDYHLIMRRGKPQIGDVLITTEAPMGNVAAIDKEDIALAQRVIKYRTNTRNLHQPYLMYYLMSEQFQKILQDHSSGSTAQGIKGSVLHQLPIILPTTSEQEAIAEALAAVDGLIAGLDKLIAKKRDVKTAVMQQLLTGKKRLPGFENGRGYKQTELGEVPKDWDVKEIGSIIDSTRLGGNYQNQDSETSRPLMKMGNLSRGYIALSKIEYIPDGVVVSEQDKLNYGDLLFNTRNTLDLVGKVAIWRNELPLAYYNSNLLRFKFKDSEVDNNFYANYAFNTDQSIIQLKGFATGTTSVAAIYTRDLFKFKMILPPKLEQKAISDVLCDIDDEITALEVRRAKTQAIKQGMMQELLTGRTRLL